jgi:hypothetical protein
VIFVGLTELLAELAADVPLALVAVTIKVYAVPFVRPVTEIGLDEPVAVIFPGEDVTVLEAAQAAEITKIQKDEAEKRIALEESVMRAED